MIVSDEMVLKAAREVERRTTAKAYGWNAANFEVWFNRDPTFVTKVNSWGHFTGTAKAKLLFETRIALEAALKDL